jgi:hypothetical protein
MRKFQNWKYQAFGAKVKPNISLPVISPTPKTTDNPHMLYRSICPNEEAARVHPPITMAKWRPKKVSGKVVPPKLMILMYPLTNNFSVF